MTMITGEQTTGFQLVVLARALQIHVATGGRMRLTRADYLGLARRLGFKGRTAKALLQDMIAKHPELNRG